MPRFLRWGSNLEKIKEKPRQDNREWSGPIEGSKMFTDFTDFGDFIDFMRVNTFCCCKIQLGLAYINPAIEEKHSLTPFYVSIKS